MKAMKESKVLHSGRHHADACTAESSCRTGVLREAKVQPANAGLPRETRM